MYGVRKCSSFILLQVVDQFSQHHLLKRLSLIHCIFFKRRKYQNTSPASWEIYMQVKKQQLELDMEQQTSSKSGKEYVKAV